MVLGYPSTLSGLNRSLGYGRKDRVGLEHNLADRRLVESPLDILIKFVMDMVQIASRP